MGKNQTLKSKFWIIIIICLAFAVFNEDAFARGGQGGGHGGGGHGGGHHGGGNRGGGFARTHGRYYYNHGGWYRHGWLGSDIFFSALAVGALIDSLPPRCATVVYGGVPYYYCDGYYYRPYNNGGYVVVEPPAAAAPVMAAPAQVSPAPVAQPQAQVPDTLIVNIPNAKGEYTKVTLKKSGDGFIGPQGEYYPGHPSLQQLKILYGK